MLNSIPKLCTLLVLGALCGCGSSTSGQALPSSGRLPNANAVRTAAVEMPTSSTPTITEFSVRRNPDHSPGAIALGPDGAAMWFGYYVDPDFGESSVDRISSDGTIKAFPFNNPELTFPSINDIVAGPDGGLWITDSGDDRIVRMATDGKIKTYRIPGANPSPGGIAVGSDGALWFTEATRNAIGRITTDGTFSTFASGISPEADLTNICAGPDGALWFTEYEGNRIGRITTAGVVTEFSSGLDPNSKPNAIASDTSGALWFTQYNEIGRITIAGKVTEFLSAVPYRETPDAIALGPDGSLWYTEHGNGGGAMVGNITRTGVAIQYTQGITPKSYPIDIARGPGDTLWFSQNADLIGRITL